MNLIIDHICIPALLTKQAPVWSATSRPAKPKSEEQITLPSSIVVLRQWSLIQARGHYVGPTSAIISTAAYLGASFSFSGFGQLAIRLAALSAFSVMPFTVIGILGLNDELNLRAARSIDGDEGESETTALISDKALATENLTLLRKWVGLNDVRASFALVSIVLAFLAIINQG
ncbi:uncharacterized protein AB675_2284 [Cyphellophora attinorum]|uniref:Uncharacterized protein n=1 Tax=Cyphellophora attinorum TaxID=1664694 RepID=A0A0N0NRQ9_9EURO|nr:uncharacterized protein AB675_2284 [Phialophora attinorum]KPI45378.1 hypothetical protein AB675_2284 [Phialophora attinorum]